MIKADNSNKICFKACTPEQVQNRLCTCLTNKPELGNFAKPLLTADLIYQPRYSQTNEPDEMGRWARKVFYKEICIAWISRLENNGKVIFSVNTFFPLTGNDNPNKHEMLDTYEDAKMVTETLWTQFLKICC